jgi:alpha-ketoglutarate-dependent 2,4-dichlorophenoxyacetate dioxygenase
MPLTVKPLSPRFGAEVSGVDLTQPVDDATRDQIIAIQDQWGVTVYRNTGLDDAGHVAFSRHFGILEKAPAPAGRKRRLGLPELFDAGNLNAEGAITQDPEAITYRKGDRLFHSDSSFMPLRTSYSMLLAHEVPTQGGATYFADTRSAYDDLPDATKARLNGLIGEHSLWWSRKQAGADISFEEIDQRSKARHPLVHTHARSKRKVLYIGAHLLDIVGMPRTEGRALIDELVAFLSQPQYIISVRYQPGDMTIWDNLACVHRGGEFDFEKERRDMRRTTVREAVEGTTLDNSFSALFQEMPKLAPVAVK